MKEELTRQNDKHAKLKELCYGLDPQVDAIIDSLLQGDKNIANKFLAIYHEHLKILNEIRSKDLNNKIQREQFDKLWDKYNAILNDEYKNMDKKEQEYFLGRARRIYQDTWNDLDGNSQIMLATALFFHDIARDAVENDFSPVVIEFCRVFENEIMRKLYEPFIPSIKGNRYYDAEFPYSEMIRALEKLKKKGVFFLSLKQMILCIKELTNTNCDISRTLSQYLIENNWNKKMLTNSRFTQKSLDYADEYRNQSAHPNIMFESDVVKCDKLTKELVHYFILCAPNSQNTGDGSLC